MSLSSVTETVLITTDCEAFGSAVGQNVPHNTDTVIYKKTAAGRIIFLAIPIPSAFRRVTKCVLSLYFQSVGSSADADGHIRSALFNRMRRQIDETVLTWNNYDGVTPWGSPGGSDTTTDIYPHSIQLQSPLASTPGRWNYDVGPLAARSVRNGEYILNLRMSSSPPSGGIGAHVISTSEHATVSQRPFAVITGLQRVGSRNTRDMLNLDLVRGSYTDISSDPELSGVNRQISDFEQEKDKLPGGDNFQTKLQPRP